jgi:hypothetical protein
MASTTFDSGKYYEDRQDWKQAFHHYSISASLNNDSLSHYKIALCQMYGMNATPIDLLSAVAHLELAKKLGKAKSLLAHCYFNGIGTEKNIDAAIKLHLSEPQDWRSKLFLLDNEEYLPKPTPVVSQEVGVFQPFKLFDPSSSVYETSIKLSKKVEQIEIHLKQVESEAEDNDIDAIFWLAIYKSRGFKSLGRLGIDSTRAKQLLVIASKQGHVYSQNLLSLLAKANKITSTF